VKDFVTKPIPASKPEPDRVSRPWGSFSQYAHNREVTVSLMSVEPGKRLSLQSHTGRGELWIVLDPGAIIQVGDAIHHPQPGDEIWIPAGTRHRLSSTAGTVRVLEVAYGNWQQEAIPRYEDDFHRPSQGE
jgi:mannose-1-phosphate guanylyltransferase/mannose-6-phosphate isomerase